MVLDRSAVGDDILACGAVLNDVERQLWSERMRHLEGVDYGIRMNFPTHLGSRCVGPHEGDGLTARIADRIPPAQVEEEAIAQTVDSSRGSNVCLRRCRHINVIEVERAPNRRSRQSSSDLRQSKPMPQL